jgi:preprotein translocase subunit SecA
MMAYKEAAAREAEESEYPALLEAFQARCAEEKKEVIAAGGLYILGTERHESRRIDNQLRGRSGRQGDPGESRFYLSLEDDLLRIFGSEKVAYVMEKLKIPEGEPIEHRFISKAIANAQKKVEAHNFDIRKHLIEYDDVMNKQREVIYEQRKEILAGENVRDAAVAIMEDTVADMVATFCPPKTRPEEWRWEVLADDFYNQFSFQPTLPSPADKDLTPSKLEGILREQMMTRFQEKEEDFTPPLMEKVTTMLLLQTIDSQWKDHLLSIDHLKEGIGLRGYGQKDPKEEYKREAYSLFMEMMGRIRQEFLNKLFRIQLANEDEMERARREEIQRRKRIFDQLGGEDGDSKPVVRQAEKVGRNDPCPCGSGKKYKKCCGR